MQKLTIHPSWGPLMAKEVSQPYMQSLRSFLMEEKKNHIIYPPFSLLFEAFNCTPLSEVKVVILGQDPYHGPGQAHGLAFSVPKSIPIPPSLKNIYKELQSDIPNFELPEHGDLTAWAKQGVLLLNTTLSVRAHMPASHQKRGWEQLTDTVISEISSQKKDVVFILWGRHAQKKSILIDQNKHYIIQSAHPSPLSAHNGFFGSKPFSKTNHFLEEKGESPINWQV